MEAFICVFSRCVAEWIDGMKLLTIIVCIDNI